MLLFSWNRERSVVLIHKTFCFSLPLTTIYCFVLLSWLVADTDVSVKTITLAYYCQHSGSFSQGRWKTHLCWASYSTKNNNELSLQVRRTMFFDSVNYFKKLLQRLHKLSSLTQLTMNLYILTTCKGPSCLVTNNRFLHWETQDITQPIQDIA